MRPEDIISVLYIASLQGSTDGHFLPMLIHPRHHSRLFTDWFYERRFSSADPIFYLILPFVYGFTVIHYYVFMYLLQFRYRRCVVLLLFTVCWRRLVGVESPRYCEKTLHWSNSRHFNVHKWRKDIYLQTDYREFRYRLDNVDTAMGRSWDGLMTRDCNHRCAGQSYPCFSWFKLQRPRQRR